MTVRTLKDAVVDAAGRHHPERARPIVYVSVDGKAAPRPVQVLYAQGDDAAVSGVSRASASCWTAGRTCAPARRWSSARAKARAAARAPAAARQAAGARASARRRRGASASAAP